MKTRAIDPVTAPPTAEKVFDDLEMSVFEIKQSGGVMSIFASLMRVSSDTGEQGERVNLGFNPADEPAGGLVQTLLETIQIQSGKLSALRCWQLRLSDKDPAVVAEAAAEIDALDNPARA